MQEKGAVKKIMPSHNKGFKRNVKKRSSKRANRNKQKRMRGPKNR